MSTSTPQNPMLRSARLSLSVLEIEQAPLLLDFVLRNRAHLHAWEGARDEAYFTLAECEKRIAAQQAAMAAGSGYAFALFDHAQHIMLGTAGLSNVVRGLFQACHLGYSLDHAHQGQGLMHEALQEVIRFAFDDLGLHRVMANYMPHNLRSEKVLQRLGFEKEGYARAYLKIGGQWQDHVLTARINPAAI
ncbi:GNAT family N-acetyltransferase [Massilia sp. W12]|uniref:GNAT family N-acetyltransferase n=1 Tax=Massilia sp. W12 TaxID=3126507 RepID=UPI0030D32F1F